MPFGLRINVARARGHSLKTICDCLEVEGIQISVTTLGSSITRMRRKDAYREIATPFAAGSVSESRRAPLPARDLIVPEPGQPRDPLLNLLLTIVKKRSLLSIWPVPPPCAAAQVPGKYRKRVDPAAPDAANHAMGREGRRQGVRHGDYLDSLIRHKGRDSPVAVGALEPPVILLALFRLLVTAVGSTPLPSAGLRAAPRAAIALTPVTLNADRE